MSRRSFIGVGIGIAVTYRWSRGGSSFTGDQYDFYGWHSTHSEEDWVEVVAALPPGARVGCFVNPRDPREAVIDRQVHGTQIGAWILAWGMFVLAGGERPGAAATTRRNVNGPSIALSGSHSSQ